MSVSDVDVALADVVDLDRYPIADLGAGEAQALVARCRQQLADDGATTLPGFVTPTAVAAMAAEANAAEAQAFFCDNTHNAYLTPDDVSLAADDPRRRRLHTMVGSIAYDLIDHDSPLRRLYNWPPLLEFIGNVLDVPALHQFADPLGACSVNVFRPGHRHQWHFDETEFTTTIMLQEAADGGFFDYVPHVRRADGGDVEHVRRILDGDEDEVRRLPFTTGTMSIFAGRKSLHRVTEVLGGRTRLVAVLAFNAEPGVTNSPEIRQLFWGRTG
jgi:alkylated DNA repair dioxygenase AlkB